MNESQGRDGQVSEQIANLIKGIDKLGDLAEALCQRLATVTRKVATSDSGAVAEKNPEYLVPLANELRNLSEKIVNVNLALESLHSRIEL